MPKITSIKQEIDDKLVQAVVLAEKQEFIGAILIELEVNRQLQELYKQETAQKLDKIIKKMTILDKKLQNKPKKEGFWSKIVKQFKK